MYLSDVDEMRREDEIRKACSMHGSKEKCLKNVVGKLERKKSLGRAQHKLQLL
jgi:hypothetical protein